MKKSEVAGLKFVVLGAARSGIAAARLLKQHGADVVVADSKAINQAGHEREELEILQIPTFWGDDAATAAQGRQVMVKSPGIPQTNPIVQSARAAGTRIISEIELASAFVPEGARVVAITGTNGKTTTTAWTAHVLNACGFNAILAGNIGDAWCNRVREIAADQAANTIFVVEVSSFQLEDLEDFQPDVAVLTNITPDHMDRYDDRIDLYVAAKANILKNAAAETIFIYNANDAESQPIVAQSKAERWSFSATSFDESIRAGLRDGNIWLHRNGEEAAVVPAAELPLPGRHNLENALCATLVASAMGGRPEGIATGLKSFGGVEHRIELCGTRPDGVRFYNDSKATNLDAMEKALLAFDQPIVLIAGGRDAHSDYVSINALVQQKVKHLVTIGEAADLIENAWGSLVPFQRAVTMKDAIALADTAAAPGDVIVFSPACKSFDMYANFEERGRDFKHEVKALLENK